MMIPSELVTVTTLPVIVVSIAAVLSILVILALCTCGKKSVDDEPHLTDIKHSESEHPPEVTPLTQNDVLAHANNSLTNGAANTSISSPQLNSTHSRGNSVDLNKSGTSNRHSAASTGSSPRPATICRTLPDIPVSQSHHGSSESSHSRTPSGTLLDLHHRSTHSQLPSIPHTGKAPVPGLDNHGRSYTLPPGVNGNQVHDQKNVSNGFAKSPQGLKLVDDDRDDYDHIHDEKKKTRPRSDYDHVVLEGDMKIIIPGKSKLKKEEENDYAEVKQENIYEGVPDDVMVLPQVSPSKVPTGSGVKKSNSIDDPYNKIRDVEPPYNKIKDDPYNKIRGDESFRSKQNDFDPYNKVKGDIEVDDLDPYDDVKDGDSTSTRPSFKKKKTFGNIDPYSFVEDDERNVSNQTDPYARVGDMESEIEDPYNKVSYDTDSTSNSVTNRRTPVPDYNDDDYASVNKAGIVEYAKVNKNRQIETLNGSAVGEALNGASSSVTVGASDSSITPSGNEIIQDEYATVVKFRNVTERTQTAANILSSQVGASGMSVQAVGMQAAQTTSAGRSGASNGAVGGVAMANVATPPEPPRAYMEQENGGGETDHYNTVLQTNSPVDIIPSTPAATGGQKKEPPYNKLSVRESLASMNARIASNTYEYVSEVDNLYATVDGSSGDGVVTTAPTANVPEAARLTGIGEYYSEIDAPAPPSLDSLHETAKSHQEEIRRRDPWDPRPGHLDYYNITEDIPGQRRSVAGRDPMSTSQHVSPTSQFHHSPRGSNQGHIRTPSNGVMTSSFEGRVSLALEENTELENDPPFNAAIHRAVVEPDVDVDDMDPNYETVEEAKSKLKYEEIKEPVGGAVRAHIYEEADDKRKYEVINGASGGGDVKIRAHVYEEVTVTNEGRRTRQRVLNAHTYEEVPEQTKDSDKKSGKGLSASGDGKKKKGHERTSSGDHWFSKKKAVDSKDKDKNGKKKSDDKDHKKEFAKK